MTGNRCKGRRINLHKIFGADQDSFKELLWEVLQEELEQEMTEHIGRRKGKEVPGGWVFAKGEPHIF